MERLQMILEFQLPGNGQEVGRFEVQAQQVKLLSNQTKTLLVL